MDDGCDVLECCLCGALCGACCASATDSGKNRRRNGRYTDNCHNQQQPVYVQPVVVQQYPEYGLPPGHPGYAPPSQAYGPPIGEYYQYPPQQYAPGQFAPQQYLNAPKH
ncbi:hypothetical protein CCR75_003516 [Bremia lactucae]|uniref:Uncharacterized protein n=1 Tax=Bremia lactucae TaxID=4779 RepID=A0A976IGS6_BRELC|nr:hypothetical protein CCR75_003516 [Bremia lactucae]